MGLSKIFPCLRKEKPKRKPGKQESPGSDGVQGNNGPPTIPPIATVSSNDATDTGGGSQEAPKEEKKRREGMTSKEAWNKAYDELATDEGTMKLVEAYEKVVKKAGKDDGATDPEADEATDDMKDPEQRDKVMRDTLESGYKRIYKSSKLTDAVGSVSSFVLKFKPMIDFAVGNIPQAALPWAGVSLGLTILLNPAQASQANRAGLAHVSSRMQWYCSLTSHLLSRQYYDVGNEPFDDVIDELETRVVGLYKALLVYQMKSVCSYYSNQGWRFVRNLVNLDDWQGEIEGVKEAEAAVQNDSKQYNDIRGLDFLGKLASDGENTQKILGDFHQTLKDYIESQRDDRNDQCLHDLFVVDPEAQMETIQKLKDTLLPAAYDWIHRTEEYQAFTNWSDKSSCQVLWLNGPAGTGKTMLMIGIISEIYGQSAKLFPGVSYFFCQAQEPENSAMDALRSMMWMLLIQQPHLMFHLTRTYKVSGAGMFTGTTAFVHLLNTFKKMLADESLSPVYLAFDALDECADGTHGVYDLISLVGDTLDGGPAGKIKWVLSSRPELEVYQILNNRKPGAVSALNLENCEEPLNAFIEYKISDVQQKLNYRDKQTLVELEAVVRERAQNTFLWVALVLGDLIERRVKERKAVNEIKKTPKSLSELYDRMMERIDKQDEDDQMLSKAVLQTVCFASRPLSYDELHVLAGLPSDAGADEFVEDCGSFLTVQGETVYLLHNSSGEYLTAYFKSQQAETHLNIFNRSIAAMSDGLRYNIYDLNPASEAADFTPPQSDDPMAALRYSCEFWVEHLEKGAGPLSEDSGAFAFLEAHLLHWLESLSLMQKSTIAVPSVRKLLEKARSTTTESSKLISFLKDAERFIIRNLSVIMRTPLQVYASALLFAPGKSEIKSKLGAQKSPFLKSIAGVGDDWDPCLQTLDSGEGTSALVFSPDGKFFATASKAVYLWEAATGVCLQEIEIEGGDEALIAFSGDSEVLTVVSANKVHLWDVNTGAWKQTIEPDCSIDSMARSPDGKIVAFASESTVNLFDASTWTLKMALTEHASPITSLSFSQNSRILASASSDKTVRFWDPADGTCKQTFNMDVVPKVVICSPDNKTAATLQDEPNGEMDYFPGTVRIWDIESGECTATWFKDLGPSVIAWSSNGENLAIAAWDYFMLLNLEKNDFTHKLIHGNPPKCMAFSKDSNSVVSASADGLMRVWDVAAPMNMTRREEDDCHVDEVTALKFSPSGNVLATGSHDMRTLLWKPVEKEILHYLYSSDRVTNIAFSRDGSKIATETSSGRVEVKVFNALTGDELFSEDTETARIHALELSPDATVVAFGTEDGNIYLRDVATGESKQNYQLEGYASPIRNLSFSKDGKSLAAAGTLDGLQVWDLAAGKCKQPFVDRKEKTDEIICIALSPDGSILALATSTCAIQLWNISLGTCKQTVDLYEEIKELSFSDDGQSLKTNQGSFAYNSGVLSNKPDKKLVRPTVYVDGSWAMRGGKKLLQIPPGYKPEITTCYGNTLVIGDVTGDVIYVEFADC